MCCDLHNSIASANDATDGMIVAQTLADEDTEDPSHSDHYSIKLTIQLLGDSERGAWRSGASRHNAIRNHPDCR
jgi:hypothetical protein